MSWPPVAMWAGLSLSVEPVTERVVNRTVRVDVENMEDDEIGEVVSTRDRSGLLIEQGDYSVMIYGDLADLEKFSKDVEAAVKSRRVLEEGRREARGW